MNTRATILILGLVLGAQDALGCQRINDFIEDVKKGTPKVLFDARSTFVGVTQEGTRSVRRYSIQVPNLVPPEIMRLEIVDEESYKPFEAKEGVRHLRVRPHSVSHWIDVSPSAVTTDPYDVLQGCPQTNDQLCGGFSIHLESKDAALEVGFLLYAKDDWLYIDEVSVAVRERRCTTPDMFLK